MYKRTFSDEQPKAWHEGFACGRLITKPPNPYSAYDYRHILWERGYRKGYLYICLVMYLEAIAERKPRKTF